MVGCATGEEAYSLAILIQEHLSYVNKNKEVKIFASDIDREAISFASKGAYPSSIKEDVSQERLDKYFIHEDGKYLIRENLRKMIVFATHDIIHQPPYGKMDLISCRNLLIYFNPVLQKKVHSIFHFCLNLGGFLFLGPSENLGDIGRFFVKIDDKAKIYKNVEVSRSINNQSYTSPDFIKQRIYAHPILKSKARVQKNNSVEVIIQSLVLTLGYTAVYLDLNYKITQPFGDLKKYLSSEMFNLNLLEIVAPELSIALGVCLNDVIKNKKASAIKEVEFVENGALRSVNVLAIPIDIDNISEQKNIIVFFNDNKLEKNVMEQWDKYDHESHTNLYLRQLERQLNETKIKLNESFQFIEETNDNIQSYNEELVSTSEEVQSTNEELQSVNEELQTVNSEYLSKIRELAELNDDLNNYFRSTAISQIYVDKNLIIRKFTPLTIKQFNLIEGDIGRSLSNISSNLRIDTILEEIIAVISGSPAKEKEVQTKDGKWYQMNITPYVRQTQNVLDGAIVTFNDISELKKAENSLREYNAEALREKNQELVRINIDLDNFIYTASHDLKASIANMEGLLRLLPAKDDSENKNIKIVEMLYVSVNRLKKIIEELTHISEVQKSIEDDFQTVNLEALFTEVKDVLDESIKKSDCKITTDFNGAPTIRFSSKNLRSILYNLTSNAIKYRSAERTPEVFIQSEDAGKYVSISATDNGLGIKSEHIGKLFSMFKRFHNHVEGAGIGLYMVKRILDNAEGKIEVVSELGRGTTFKVLIKKIAQNN